jgi:hypothetical protein
MEVVPRGIMARLYVVKEYPPDSGIFLVTNNFRHFVKNFMKKEYSVANFLF